jgi:hypothetical protein
MLKQNRNLRVARLLQSLLVVLTASLSACAKPDIATVPAHPTFELDVKPLLADHCLLCHGYPATRGAPTSFRLDVYATSGGVQGAYEQGSRLVKATLNDHMPPAALWGEGVGPNGKKLLQNWQTDGYPD